MKKRDVSFHDFNYEELTCFQSIKDKEKDEALDALMNHLGLEIVRIERFSHGDSHKDVTFEIGKKGTTPPGLRELK